MPGVLPVTALDLAPHAELHTDWAREGRVILAQFHDDEVVVYQAFHPETAAYAVEHQRLGGPRYSLRRMSWIKPNFLWMMYRCGWLEKDEDQGRVLAIHLERAFFDELLAAAVPSSWVPPLYPTREAWQADVQRSQVRLQWDPDHCPRGGPLARRAIQLGLRGDTLRRFVHDHTRAIEDVSDFVRAQRTHRGDSSALTCPRERAYPVTSAETRRRLGLATPIPLGTRELVCHPSTPAPGIDGVQVQLELDHRELALTYRVSGDRSATTIPGRDVRLDPARLWAHTCAEVFVAGEGDPYVEWNLSPTGQAARFEFARYRERVAAAHPAHAGIETGERDGAFVLRARVPLPSFAQAAARLSTTVVLAHADGHCSYWALRHPKDTPDFHDRDGFALSLTCDPTAAMVDAP